MTGVTKILASRTVLVVALVMAAVSGAHAQWGWTTQPSAQTPPAPRGENLSAGKSAAQLFSSDCTGSGCHKSAQGLSRDRGAGSLASFLREHYTTSRESAATLAAYLVGLPGGRGDPKPQPRAAARPDDKPAERKPAAVTPPASVPTPSGETGDKPAPAARTQRGRQATTAPAAPTPQAPPPEPVAAPAVEPAPAAVVEPPKPAEPPKPKWDIFD